MKYRAAIAVALFSVSFCFGQIQPAVSSNPGSGNIDWSTRYVVATGIGAPNPDWPKASQRAGAIRAAQLYALRNALEKIKSIYITSNSSAEFAMLNNDALESRISGYLKGFDQVGDPKFYDDGSVEVTMRIPLDGYGGITDIMVGGSLSETPTIPKYESSSSSKGIIFTGLIVDCKGLNIKPALSPKILDESGQEVFGSAYVSREWAIKNGITGYAKEVSSATKLVDRIGNNPGKIKALKASGDNKTDIVISNTDATDIRVASTNLRFLSECRVIFVID
ncbi:MAG TPA: hypothetical protein VHP36_01345 [Chitinispirillaceae bacterium]|nr:hypothetical protein [Chitinispirillaceae bacterium]